MKRLAISVTGAILMACPAAAQAVFELVPRTEGATACWQRVYDEAHLLAHPDQTVTAMTLGAGFYRLEDAPPEDSGNTLFGMAVTLRDGTKGTTSGVCWSDGSELRCGVECDGGGVVVSGARNGSALIDLGTTGYIRMEGECGGYGEMESFALEPGLDDKTFLLGKVDAKVCKGLMSSW